MSDPLILPFRGVAPRLDPSAFIAAGAVVIGDVEIGAESSVWPGCVLRGDMGPIRIGKRVNIQDGTVIHITDPSQGGKGTFVGDEVTVGHMALLHDCVVEDRAFIGMRATLLDGAKVESYGMLAAGALLTPGKIVKGRELWAGSPAKFFRAISDEESAALCARAEEYAALARGYK